MEAVATDEDAGEIDAELEAILKRAERSGLGKDPDDARRAVEWATGAIDPALAGGDTRARRILENAFSSLERSHRFPPIGRRRSAGPSVPETVAPILGPWVAEVLNSCATAERRDAEAVARRWCAAAAPWDLNALQAILGPTRERMANESWRRTMQAGTTYVPRTADPLIVPRLFAVDMFPDHYSTADWVRKVEPSVEALKPIALYFIDGVPYDGGKLRGASPVSGLLLLARLDPAGEELERALTIAVNGLLGVEARRTAALLMGLPEVPTTITMRRALGDALASSDVQVSEAAWITLTRQMQREPFVFAAHDPVRDISEVLGRAETDAPPLASRLIAEHLVTGSTDIDRRKIATEASERLMALALQQLAARRQLYLEQGEPFRANGVEVRFGRGAESWLEAAVQTPEPELVELLRDYAFESGARVSSLFLPIYANLSADKLGATERLLELLDDLAADRLSRSDRHYLADAIARCAADQYIVPEILGDWLLEQDDLVALFVLRCIPLETDRSRHGFDTVAPEDFDWVARLLAKAERHPGTFTADAVRKIKVVSISYAHREQLPWRGRVPSGLDVLQVERELPW